MKNRVCIIAEAGVNHNGSLEIAKRLAYEAKNAGADIVKFQTAKLSSLVTKTAAMANYQKENMGKEMTQQEMLKRLLLGFEEFTELSSYCKEIGISFLSTPFDIASIDFLNTLDMGMWKIPSGEITNYPYLIKIAKTQMPVILSTGMSTLEEIRDCYDLLKKNGTKEIALLHCTTQYPTQYEDVNLRAMLTLKEEFDGVVGYSDHTIGVEASVAAVAMGAGIIEKHFTLSREMEGPDHKASLEPYELRQMISMIRNVEKSFGDGRKEPCDAEKPNIYVARKSIVANTNIMKGEKFSEYNITTKRPGMGISPMRWTEVIGREAKRDFVEDELIEL